MKKPSMLADIRGRVGRRGGKAWRAVSGALTTATLSLRGAKTSCPLTDPSNNVVVSLTSYGDRLRSVNLTIESIGRGSTRPGRLILWTDPGVDVESLPWRLLRLRRRGLEVLPSPANFGPHTKYYPYALTFAGSAAPLVTADDDSLYPRRWLRGLMIAARESPEGIVCYRAHRVAFDEGGGLAPYNTWTSVRSTSPSLLHFATGVSGVWYPPDFVVELARRGDEFLKRSPRADDVWLHYVAVTSGRTIRQVGLRPKKFPEAARTQKQALHRSNTALSQNDLQIEATYTADVVARLEKVGRES
ncbi:glycosyltransferase family 2 protein [Rathayibacter sp. VKM Ac-2754]|uniref:glycosyltransferase family 2 protein n=1 Tax=Rathayibacter sp. VKM Ac-2754 TaxID=2609251 RepID=UPI00135BB0AC|nr:glycosyltransferase family 2 protein [Rathayibacter sp. VKM Ac-2754]MWV60590.1 glycosyltransferase family 2 protein [Rathayibacter sp. VKM Ac-2754]